MDAGSLLRMMVRLAGWATALSVCRYVLIGEWVLAMWATLALIWMLIAQHACEIRGGYESLRDGRPHA